MTVLINMAAGLGRLLSVKLLRPKKVDIIPTTQLTTSFKTIIKGKKNLLYTTLGALAGGLGALALVLDCNVRASDMQLHPAKYQWSHIGLFNSLDHASIRRGYEVYKQVCAACHSLRFVAYRDFVNVIYTEAQAKAEAEEIQVTDGPDDSGSMYTRSGKLSDYIPSPYPNEASARYANNGAYPPDLSHIVLAREGGDDYVFSLLLGYCDPPSGVTLREGQNYNPYFPGGAISMAQSVFNEVVEFTDGTPPTASQISKDVVTFLRWAAEPEYDDRKRMLLRVLGIFPIMISLMYTIFRHKHSSMKTRQIIFQPKK